METLEIVKTGSSLSQGSDKTLDANCLICIQNLIDKIVQREL
jgi:hypothetical protein